MQLPFRRQNAPPPLRPAGHSAALEALVQPIIVLGSTILSGIACYVLAQAQWQSIINGHASELDWILITFVLALAFMIDVAMILSASRLKMHISRGRRDILWAVVSGSMLLLCLSVETMTLIYFGYLVDPGALSSNAVHIIQGIHEVLFFIRYGMPPLIIIFFTTGLLPLTIEPADRDRATKASTSVNIAAIQEDLVKVGDLATRADKIQALADQIALFEHASRATQDEIERDKTLLEKLRNQGGTGQADSSTIVQEETKRQATIDAEPVRQIEPPSTAPVARADDIIHLTDFYQMNDSQSTVGNGARMSPPIEQNGTTETSRGRTRVATAKPLPESLEYLDLLLTSASNIVATHGPSALSKSALALEVGDSEETIIQAIHRMSTLTENGQYTVKKRLVRTYTLLTGLLN